MDAIPTGSPEIQERQIEETPLRTPVSFPSQPKKKSGKKSLVFVFVILILLLGGAAWFIFGRGKSESTTSTSPSPTRSSSTPTPTPTPRSVDRKNIDIEVLNGTGIAGEASFLQTELGKLGYETIKASNATRSDYQDTEVGFSEKVSEEVKQEITSKLEDFYKKVVVKSSTSISYDIQVITGYKKGHTPTPSPLPKPTSSVTPTATASGTPTTTPTSTPSPTP